MNWQRIFLAVILAYLIGSLPTALLYSRLVHGQDIRELGDGNMGARNTKRQYGMRAGVIVAGIDILKGLLAVLLAQALALALDWQLLSGAAVILGHDFPVFARFKGGQGFATTTGVFYSLLPIPMLMGTVIYVVLYLLTRNSDIAAGVGMGLIVLQSLLRHDPVTLVAFMVLMLLFIPFKKWLDQGRSAGFLTQRR